MTSIKIAVSEIRSIFVSPVAWVLYIIFVVQTSVRFVERGLFTVARQQFDGVSEGQSFASYLFSANDFSIASGLQDNLIFYIPLLTMGLLSRETQTGTIRLLLSSPIRISDIVIGKYLAALAYIGLMIAFLIALLFLGCVLVPGLDYPLALAAFLSIFLLASAYAAIGLFMSSLTSHQLVAAAGTLAVLSILAFIGGVGQRVPILADVTYWLSMAGRAEYMRNGLVASKDVWYFFSIIGLFLGFTWFRLYFQRASLDLVGRASRILTLLGVVLLFGAFTSRPSFTAYWDATFNDRRTLGPEGQAAMANIEGPWHLTVYANVLHHQINRHLPATQRPTFRSLFQDFVRENHRVHVEYKFFYGPTKNPALFREYEGLSDSEIAQIFASQYRFDFDSFLSIEDVKDQIGWRADTPQGGFYVLGWNGRREVIGTFDDLKYYPDRRTITAGMRRLGSSPMTIGYVVDAQSRPVLQRGASSHFTFVGDYAARYTLVNLGFDVEEVSLKYSNLNEVDVLAIADPKVPLDEAELVALERYLETGGNLIVFAEPGSEEPLTPLFGMLGVEFDSNSVIQSADGGSLDLAYPDLSAGWKTNGLLEPPQSQRPVLIGAVGLKPVSGGMFDFETVLTTGGDGSKTVGSKGVAVVAERLVSDKRQRIVVVGDADFASGSALAAGVGTRPSILLLSSLFRYLSEDQYPITFDRLLDGPDARRYDDSIGIELRDLDHFKFYLYGLIPAALFVFGSGLLAYRRKW